MACKARLSSIGVVTAVVLAATACGGSTTTSDSPSTSAAAPATTSAPADATTAPAGAKVSANTASDSEIESALSAAGVNNAARWAHEVVEYRPYPAEDPNLTKLRDNLAKYNPGQETVDKIVSALTP
jgi:DNA uptake protein ComE-like DNA-binding protein